MNAAYRSAAIGWIDGEFPRPAAAGAVALALGRVRGFFAALARKPNRPGHGGRVEPPEEPRRQNTLWDDPALWVLMLH